MVLAGLAGLIGWMDLCGSVSVFTLYGMSYHVIFVMHGVSFAGVFC